MHSASPWITFIIFVSRIRPGYPKAVAFASLYRLLPSWPVTRASKLNDIIPDSSPLCSLQMRSVTSSLASLTRWMSSGDNTCGDGFLYWRKFWIVSSRLWLNLPSEISLKRPSGWGKMYVLPPSRHLGSTKVTRWWRVESLCVIFYRSSKAGTIRCS